MVFDIGVAMTWLLFLALFPITYYWLRRAWRIAIKRDFSEVALKRGEPPPNPEKYAPWALLINLVGAAILIFVIVGIVAGVLEYDAWTAIAGSTLWLKIIFDFILSRQAHLFAPKKDAAKGK